MKKSFKNSFTNHLESELAKAHKKIAELEIEVATLDLKCNFNEELAGFYKGALESQIKN